MGIAPKRRILGAFFVLGLCTMFVLLIHACTDFGLEADFLKGQIAGQLQAEAPAPENSDEIRVALVTDFPPSGFADLILSEDLWIRDELQPFQFQTQLGSFDALIGVWKARGEAWSPLTNTIGVLCDENGDMLPIELTDENPMADNIVLDVNFRKVTRTALVRGKITFAGEWPSNIDLLAIAFLENFNISICNPPDFAFLSTQAVDELTYEKPIAPGTYPLVLIAYLPVGGTFPDDLIQGIIGAYDGGALTLAAGDTLDNININAEFQ